MCVSYIVCEGAQPFKAEIEKYLLDINESLNKYFRDQNSDQDIESIVPLDLLKKDKNFYNYIKKSNEK